ncbi:hypothetical protein ACIBSV_12255 [Embleya sp. NPDC050154]|uniref:hypothetical protein n=1 Tax=Embleya sp. NPDC050154 TaxID=3363988 RepID=UPI0037B615FF
MTDPARDRARLVVASMATDAADATDLLRALGLLDDAPTRRRAAAHGTHSGAVRHRQTGTRVCDECAEAERAYQREQRRRNPAAARARDARYREAHREEIKIRHRAAYARRAAAAREAAGGAA